MLKYKLKGQNQQILLKLISNSDLMHNEPIS